MKKAIVAEIDINKDEKISLDNVAFKRTSEVSDVSQKEVFKLINRKAKDKILKDSMVNFENTY